MVLPRIGVVLRPREGIDGRIARVGGVDVSIVVRQREAARTVVIGYTQHHPTEVPMHEGMEIGGTAGPHDVQTGHEDFVVIVLVFIILIILVIVFVVIIFFILVFITVVIVVVVVIEITLARGFREVPGGSIVGPVDVVVGEVTVPTPGHDVSDLTVGQPKDVCEAAFTASTVPLRYAVAVGVPVDAGLSIVHVDAGAPIIHDANERGHGRIDSVTTGATVARIIATTPAVPVVMTVIVIMVVIPAEALIADLLQKLLDPLPSLVLCVELGKQFEDLLLCESGRVHALGEGGEHADPVVSIAAVLDAEELEQITQTVSVRLDFVVEGLLRVLGGLGCLGLAGLGSVLELTDATPRRQKGQADGEHEHGQDGLDRHVHATAPPESCRPYRPTRWVRPRWPVRTLAGSPARGTRLGSSSRSCDRRTARGRLPSSRLGRCSRRFLVRLQRRTRPRVPREPRGVPTTFRG